MLIVKMELTNLGGRYREKVEKNLSDHRASGGAIDGSESEPGSTPKSSNSSRSKKENSTGAGSEPQPTSQNPIVQYRSEESTAPKAAVAVPRRQEHLSMEEHNSVRLSQSGSQTAPEPEPNSISRKYNTPPIRLNRSRPRKHRIKVPICMNLQCKM